MKAKEELHNEIIRCAKERFSACGYKETTMRDIAEDVGIATGTIYTYFRNKKELFRALNIPEAEKLAPKDNQRRKDILRIALILFGEYGYDSVTMDDIASKLHISKSTLYTYFDNKESLFANLLKGSSFNLYTEQLLVENEEMDIRDIILEIGRSYLAIGEDPERAALFKTVIRDSIIFPELGTLYFEQGINPACMNIMEYINRHCYKNQKCIKNLQSLHTFVLTYIATLQSYILMHDVMKGIPDGVSKEDYLQTTTDIFLNYLKQNDYL